MRPPRPGDKRRQDGKQGRAHGVMLGEPERDEYRDEQDPAAASEQSRQHPGGEAEHDRERDRHLTNSQTAIARTKPANSSSTVRAWSRCWTVAPPTAPRAAGRPTSAA